MNLSDRVTILSQIEGELFHENGIHTSPLQVAGINIDSGLMVLAVGKQSLSQKAIEILMDDMLLNLNPEHGRKSRASTRASICLQESLYNIHDYLLPLLVPLEKLNTPAPVQLVILQLIENGLICTSLGGMSCLKFRENQILELSNKASTKGRLGLDKFIQPHINEQDVRAGDILVLVGEHFLQQIGMEFVRLTLSRFSDNLEMVLRQLNTRYSRNSAGQKPALILCRIDQSLEQKRGWLGRLGGG